MAAPLSTDVSSAAFIDVELHGGPKEGERARAASLQPDAISDERRSRKKTKLETPNA